MSYQPIPESAGHKVIKGNIAPHLDFGLFDEIEAREKPYTLQKIEQIFDNSTGFVPVSHFRKFRCKRAIEDIATRKGFKPYPREAVNFKYYAKDGCELKEKVKQDRITNGCASQIIEMLDMYGCADMHLFTDKFNQQYLTKAIWAAIKELEAKGYSVRKIKGDNNKVLRLELIRNGQSVA